MKKNLLNKFTLKIISVLIAVFVWLIVVTVEDPIMDRRIADVPVTLVNEDYIEKTGQVPMIKDGRNTVTVIVTGKTSIVSKLEASDITATADLQQIVTMDSDPLMVPVTASCPKLSESQVATSPNNIAIETDDLSTQEYMIAANSGETKPGDGYVVGKLKSNPDKVTVRGPASIIKNIDKVVANIDVSGMTMDETVTAQFASDSTTGQSNGKNTLTIFDKNGDPLSASQMKSLKFSDTTAMIDVDLWALKTDVPIQVDYGGKPTRGYQVGTVTTTPVTISVAGTDEALREFEESGGTIIIPPEIFSVSDKSKDFEENLEMHDIAELLPNDMKLVTGNETLSVKVTILPLKTKEYNILTTSIVVNNKPDDLNVVYESEKVVVRVKGKDDEAFSSLTEADIGTSIDVKDLTAGDYELALSITVPEGFEVLDTSTVKFKLTKPTETADKTN